MPQSASILCHENDQSCYQLLWAVESYLRTMVRWEVRAAGPRDWQGMIPAELLEEVKERQDQERRIGYLDERKSGLLSYLTLAELKDVLLEKLADRLRVLEWPPEDLLRSEFKKLIAIRNKVAHFRPVTERDLRVARRFAEDLADWTRAYRRIREYGRTISWEAPDRHSQLTEGKIRLDRVAGFWVDMAKDGRLADLKAEVLLVGSYVALSMSCRAGSVNPQRFRKCAADLETAISFWRIGNLGEKVCCYSPIKIGDDEIVKAWTNVRDLMVDEVPGLSSEAVRTEFEFAEREGVMPWDLALPLEFRM